mmetsp:Transcript_270/g.909  ORF Transcript_270/g.909 Transcript_270/m.909 type:complete len:166 (+) Transcript_270:32-529(+)
MPTQSLICGEGSRRMPAFTFLPAGSMQQSNWLPLPINAESTAQHSQDLSGEEENMQVDSTDNGMLDASEDKENIRPHPPVEPGLSGGLRPSNRALHSFGVEPTADGSGSNTGERFHSEGLALWLDWRVAHNADGRYVFQVYEDPTNLSPVSSCPSPHALRPALRA